MSYELFISSHSVSSEPFISLVKEGFRFSAAFVQKYHLERASGVRLYFNRPKHAIGFYFATAANAEDGTLKPKRHAGGLVVRAKGFFTSQGIDPAVYAGRYQPREVKDGTLKRLLVIQLRQPAGHDRKAPKA